MGSTGSTLFTLIWSDAVTPLGRRIYALRASVRRISDSDCGSSPWPTTTVEDARSSARHGYMITGNQGTTLLDAARLATLGSWPTTQARDGNHGGGQAKRAMGETRHGSNLDDFALLAPDPWTTPQVSDQNGERKADGKRGIGLNSEAQLVAAPWATPVRENGDHSHNERDRTNGATLNVMAARAGWATPLTNDAKQGTGATQALAKQTQPGGMGLAAQAAGWATPVATEIRNTLENYSAMKANMATGPRSAITHPSLQAQLVVSGEPSSGSPVSMESRGQLNPDLSRWLMALPAAWLFACPSDPPKRSASPTSSSRKPPTREARPRKATRSSTGTTEPARSEGSATRSSRSSRSSSSAPRAKRAKRKRD